MITQDALNELLDNARTNGYFTDLSVVTVPFLVDDLKTCTQECAAIRDEVLTPLVQTWYDAHRLIGDSQAGKAVDC